MLAPTPRHILVDQQDRPYFLWDTEMTLHEFEQMCFDVRADDTVRFDHGTGFGINIVPRAALLCLQPAAQWAKQICQAFAASVWTSYALKLWQKFIGQIGAPSVFARDGIPTRSLDDDFVHVWSHDELMVDGCDLCRTGIRHFDTDG